MSDSSPLQRSLAALERFFTGTATMRDTLSDVTELAIVAVPQAEFAGITMAVDDTPGTWIFTHPEVPRVDRVQYDTGDGPCLQAWSTGLVQAIESTRGGGPWPRFRQVAFEHGILSTISLPLSLHNGTIGAINLYARSEDAFGENDIATGRMFAAQAALVLSNAQAYWDSQSLDDTLGALTDGRAVIEQAKGVLMATVAVGAERARELLAARARRDGTTIRGAAAALVESVGTRREGGASSSSEWGPGEADERSGGGEG